MVTEQLEIIEEEQIRYIRMKLAQTSDPTLRKQLKEQLDKFAEGLGESSEKQTLLAE